MDLAELWLQFKVIFIDIVKYGFPTVAIILSGLSYWDSRKAKKVQDRLLAVEEKLKEYELEEKEKEREESTKACVEARIYNVSKGKYRMKVWNSGKATAYKVDFKIPDKHGGIICKDKVPYEFLEPGKSFEEHAILTFGGPRTLSVITIWEDSNNKSHSKKNIVSY